MAALERYTEVDRTLLGYQGKLYPEDMVIEVRGANALDIRTWSNIDDNPVNVAKHINQIIGSCVKVTSKNEANNYSYKDLYEHDKIALLLMIRFHTFVDDKTNNLFVKGKCTAEGCGKQFDKLVVQVSNLTYKEPDKQYESKINSEYGIFELPTKTFGTIKFQPSTIGVGMAMMSWMSTFDAQFVSENKTMFKIVQTLVSDWRSANDKNLRHLQIERYNNMNEKGIGLYLDIIDKFNVAVKEELEFVCPDCGNTFRSPLAIEGGYLQMFVPVQSIDDELL